MKEFAKLNQPIGSDGGVVVGAVSGGIDEQFISVKAEVELKYPTAKAVEPLTAVVDKLVDKLEAVIPGDQLAMAAEAKAEAKAAILKIIAELAAKAS